jgi:hypothetical protein
MALLPYSEFEALKPERVRLKLERYVAEQKALSREVAAQASDDEVMEDALRRWLTRDGASARSADPGTAGFGRSCLKPNPISAWRA